MTAALRLMVIKGKYYQGLARQNKMEEIVIPAPRGKIFDRKGRMVAESIEGVKRKYEYGESLSSVTGYVGKVNEEEMRNNKCKVKMRGESLIGRGGIEEFFDCDLRGKDGKSLMEVDAKGRAMREQGRLEAEEGKRIDLSIDAYWQKKIYEMLDGKKAVVVISEVDTGKLLVMVSSPAFDANLFSYERDNMAIKSYLEDKNNLPMLNRAIMANYHPGSVFKIVTATAGLETGVVSKTTLIEDTGIIKIGEYSYANWLWNKRGATDGMVDMEKALKRSNDIYFYKLGGLLGADNMKDWAGKFGLGKKTGIELTGEITGLIPDENWKIKTKKEKWFLGNSYHMAIGQGDVNVTPLQINEMTGVVASGGKRCRPSLLKESRVDCEKLSISRDSLEIVKRGMLAACKEGGTAWPLFNFKTEIACKTGTAEVGDGTKDTHAWLTAFAPADNPEVVITVLVERGGEGSDAAAPIVGDILKEWFEEPETIVPRYTPVPTKN